MNTHDDPKDLESIKRIRSILLTYKSQLENENKGSAWKSLFQSPDEYEFNNLSKKLGKLGKENKNLIVQLCLKTLSKEIPAKDRLKDLMTVFDEYKGSLERRRADATDPFLLYLIKEKIFEMIPAKYMPKSWQIKGIGVSNKINAELDVFKQRSK